MTGVTLLCQDGEVDLVDVNRVQDGFLLQLPRDQYPSGLSLEKHFVSPSKLVLHALRAQHDAGLGSTQS